MAAILPTEGDSSARRRSDPAPPAGPRRLRHAQRHLASRQLAWRKLSPASQIESTSGGRTKEISQIPDRIPALTLALRPHLRKPSWGWDHVTGRPYRLGCRGIYVRNGICSRCNLIQDGHFLQIQSHQKNQDIGYVTLHVLDSALANSSAARASHFTASDTFYHT